MLKNRSRSQDMPSCVSFLSLSKAPWPICVSALLFIFFSFLFLGVLNLLHKETKTVFKSSISNTPINCLKITDNFYKLF